jgi:hypothetical protein
VTGEHLGGIQPSPQTPIRQPIESDIGLGL